MRSLLTASTLLALALTASAQTTWYVDGTGCDGSGTGTDSDPFCTIQECVDAASDGDTILIRRGVYEETIAIPGRQLEIRGEQGAEETIVLGIAPHEWERLPIFSVVAGATLTFENLTMRHGSVGIVCDSAWITARGCIFEDNYDNQPGAAEGYGGGINASRSAILVDTCTFIGNASDYYGGAISVQDGTLELINATFLDNFATGGGIFVGGSVLNASACVFSAPSNKSLSGGAIYSSGSQVTLDRCTFSEFGSGEAHGVAMSASLSTLEVRATVFEDNGSSQGSGVIRLSGCSASFSECRFEHNWTSSGQMEGGAFRISGSVTDVTTFEDCQFIDNSAAEGGAVLAENATVHFARCLFRGNLAYSTDGYGHGDGGAVSSWAAEVDFDQYVFIENKALGWRTYRSGRGGAVMGPATLEACTLYGNAADSAWGYGPGEGGGVFDCTLNSCIVWKSAPDSLSGSSTADWCDIEGGWSGTGNFDADPLFWGAAQGDFHLLPGSPCIDTGDPARTDDDGSRLEVGAFPFDPIYCGGPSTYCEAKVNSLGCVPSIAWSGEPTLTGPDDFHVLATNIVPSKFGILLWGASGPANTPFFGGTLCVAPPQHRSPRLFSGGQGGGACDGSFDFHLTHSYMQAQGLVIGSRIYIQLWYRDPMHLDGTGTGLTDGLTATICIGT